MMFRALLWKEWRELWVLPVVAAPLAATSFFITKSDSPVVTAVVWNAAFSIWLFLAAAYIPTHLYVREKETRTANFLEAKTLDQFRLWWFRLFVGIVTLIAVGLVLAGITALLCFSYEKAGGFVQHRSDILVDSIFVGLLLFCVSSFCSAFSRRQVVAIVGTFLFIVLLCAVLIVLQRYWRYSYHRDILTKLLSSHRTYGMSIITRSLILFPPLLFGSLLIFTRRNIWRRTKKNFALAYGFSAAAAIVLMAAGLARALPTSSTRYRSPSPSIRIFDYTGGLTHMLLQTAPGKDLVALDLSEEQANIIDRGRIDDARLTPGCKELLYTKHRRIGRYELFHKYFKSDLQGEHKTSLSRSDWSDIMKELAEATRNRSPDGMYWARTWTEPGCIIVGNTSGDILLNQEFPELERARIHALGWDYDSRFYFAKSFEKGGLHTTNWRVGPDDFVPEQVPNSHFFFDWRTKIRDGKWIPYFKYTGGARERHEYWIYDIAAEKNHLLTANMLDSEWSHDGTLTAFLEKVGDAPEEEPWKPIPFNLVIYEPSTGNRSSLLVENLSRARLESFSPSNKYLLLSGKEEDARGNHPVRRGRVPFLFSSGTQKIKEIEIGEQGHIYVTGTFSEFLRWVGQDKLLWNFRNKFVVTEANGSNPEEIFRVEDGKFYLYGEEQS